MAPGADRQPRILLVDDDEVNLLLTGAALRERGFTVHEATGGLAAMRMLADWSPDVMVLDAVMPGMDGFQFLASVAQGGFAGALIIVSGQTSDVLHSAALVAKLRRFTVLGSIAKPVDKEALSGMLAMLG